MIEEITEEEKEEKTYYVLSNDIIFKNTFDTKERLKRLLEETLNIKVYEIFKSNIEMPVENVKERRKYLDLILETNEGIINVEINHGFKDELPYRNFIYFCKLISMSVKKAKSYTNIKKHIQLNISWNLDKYLDFDITNTKIIKCHLADDKTHNKIYDKIFEIVYINMDYFEDVWYHGDIEKENPFLMFLAAPTEEKMDLICEGDEFMEELSNKVKRLNEDPDILDVIIENEDEIIKNSIYDNGVNAGIELGISQGITQGITQGISQGITQGIEQNKIEIAKKMLKEEFNIKDIAKITGITEKEIEDLK